MTGWFERAGQLQQSIRAGEATTVQEYTAEQVAQATVHARQDLVLVVSFLETLTKQTVVICRLLWAILSVLIAIAWKILG